MRLVNHPQPLQFCRLYRAFEMTTITFLMFCFDIVLILRSAYLPDFYMLPLLMMRLLVIALYGRRTWSCVFAICAVLIECMATITSVALTIPVAMYDAACVMVPVPKSILAYIVGVFTAQATLLWLASRKRQHVVRERPSIACITIRDGMLAFVCLSGKRGSSHKFSDRGAESTHARKYFS